MVDAQSAHPAGVVDAEGHAWQAYAPAGPTLFLVRPDGYVGLALETAGAVDADVSAAKLRAPRLRWLRLIATWIASPRVRDHPPSLLGG